MSDDKIWKQNCALRDELEDLIKRVVASLPREDAITFLYGMQEQATGAMCELEDRAWESRQDVIYSLLP
jgi:hypothetical protein